MSVSMCCSNGRNSDPRGGEAEVTLTHCHCCNSLWLSRSALPSAGVDNPRTCIPGGTRIPAGQDQPGSCWRLPAILHPLSPYESGLPEQNAPIPTTTPKACTRELKCRMLFSGAVWVGALLSPYSRVLTGRHPFHKKGNGRHIQVISSRLLSRVLLAVSGLKCKVWGNFSMAFD